MIYIVSLIVLAVLLLRPAPAHADPTSILAPVLSSVVGGFFEKDAPSPPTAADMQTALQKALDPMLLKIAEGMNINLGQMAMNEYNKKDLSRRREDLPRVIASANSVRRNLSKYTNEEISAFKKAAEVIGKTDPKLLEHPNTGIGYKGGDYAGEAMMKRKAIFDANPELGRQIDEMIKKNGNNFDEGWGELARNISAYSDYEKYGEILNNLPINGINEAYTPEEVQAKIKEAGLDLVGLAGAVEKGASKASDVPVPSVKMTDEENALLTKANELVKNNPNIKTVDEAIAMMKDAVTGSDEQSQKTIAALNGLSSKFANYQQSGDQTDLMNKIKDRTNFKWSGDYLNNMIKSQLDPLSRQLADKSAAINEQYAAKGFGNSTGVITEGLMPLNKEYAGVAGDIINKSNYQAEEMANQIINDAISQGISLTDSIEKNKLGAWANAADTTLAAGNIGLQNNTFKANTAGDIAGLGTTRQALETSSMDVANKLNQQKQNLALTNIGLEAAARAEQRQKEQDKLNNIISIYGSQNQQSANLADAALTGYKNAYADTVARNTDLATGINNVVTGIFSKPKTQTQTVQGGFSGATQGANAGFSNKYKARTSNLYNLK